VVGEPFRVVDGLTSTRPTRLNYDAVGKVVQLRRGGRHRAYRTARAARCRSLSYVEVTSLDFGPDCSGCGSISAVR